MARTARTRYLKRRKFERTSRSKRLRAFVAQNAADLSGTGAAKTFTATAATNQLTITSHGYSVGAGPFLASNVGGALPGGMNTTALLWVKSVVDANTITVCAGSRNAPELDITSAGSGTHTLTKAATEKAIFETMKRNPPKVVQLATDVDNL